MHDRVRYRVLVGHFFFDRNVKLKPSRRCINLIKKWEGYHNRLSNGDCVAYPDVGSHDGEPITIGWGTTKYRTHGKLRYNRTKVMLGDTLTAAQADYELQAEVEEVSDVLFSKCKLLNQNQFDCAVSFFYNTGTNNPQMGRLERGELAGFEYSLPLYVNGGNGKRLLGLVSRRAEELKLWKEPVQMQNKKLDVTWINLVRHEAGDTNESILYAMNGSDCVELSAFQNREQLISMLQKYPLANNVAVGELDWHREPEEEKVETPKPKDLRQKILSTAIARCSKGRAHSPGNVIDTEVLDPLRPIMKRLGHMGQSDNDAFYNWCAANVTKILRDCGLTVPDQPTVKGRPYWASVALVETWKAWAIDKGAWRNSRSAEIGDIVIYDWDSNGVTDHIGIITELKPNGVVAAEGNKSNREAIIYRDRSMFAGTIDIEKLFNLNS